MNNPAQGPRDTGSYPPNQRPTAYGTRITHLQVDNLLTRKKAPKKRGKKKR